MLRGATAAFLTIQLFSLTRNCIAQQTPATGGWALAPDALLAGYKLETAFDGGAPCAVLMPPAPPSAAGQTEGNMEKTLSAASYRGKTLRLSAWLRVRAAGFKDSAQLWMRVNRPAQASPADNLSGQPVSGNEWTRSEINLTIDADAESLSFGVLSAGGGAVWVRDVSLLIVGGVQSPAAAAATEPANLRFTAGPPGVSPPGWEVLASAESSPAPYKGAPYKAEATNKGCRFGPPCAVLSSPASLPPDASGTLLQHFSAAKYRGRTVRLRASVRLQRAGKDDYVRLWLRTGRADETVNASNLFEHQDYRTFRNTDWTPGEIVRKIDGDIEELGIGAMLTGRGRVFIDEVSFSILPDAPDAPVNAAPLLRPRTELAILADVLPETNWPSLPAPGHDEQGAVVNGASGRAMRYIRDLPNFLCNLRIDRSENLNDNGWRKRDVLNVQLGFSERTEHYKLTTVNGKPATVPYRAIGGAISEGDFGSVLAEIFRPHSARFHWDHWTNLRSHVAHVFRYEITSAKSEYELHFGTAQGKTASTVTAHHGYVYIEKDTNNILRIEQIADPPAGFPLRYAVNTIDYDWNDVGGQRFLLPLRAEITMGSASLRSFNAVEFRDYRKFAAESQISFDQP
jgi:hypothetical protein